MKFFEVFDALSHCIGRDKSEHEKKTDRARRTHSLDTIEKVARMLNVARLELCFGVGEPDASPNITFVTMLLEFLRV